MRIYRDYAHDTDISYGEYGKKYLLDIWRRPDLDRNGRAPVLLQVPGGGWTTGSQRGQAHPLMSHLAQLGWVCVSINYRVSPRSTWSDHIIDVKHAIAWVKAPIGEYVGDPDFIAITGGSAGGHLSSLAALTQTTRRFSRDSKMSTPTCRPPCRSTGLRLHPFGRTASDDGAVGGTQCVEADLG